MSVPEFIQPRSLTEMRTDEIDALLDRVREVRLRGLRIYEETQARKAQIKDQHDRDQLDQRLGMLMKEVAKMDRYIERVEGYIGKVRSLRLQLGIEYTG